MLGSSLTQQLFASANSIAILPQIWAEWNYNSFIQPYVVTSSSGTSIATASLNSASFWNNGFVSNGSSSTTNSSIVSISGQGIPDPTDTASTVLQFTTLDKIDPSDSKESGIIASRVISDSITLPKTSYFYKFVFFVKTAGINYTDGDALYTQIKNANVSSSGTNLYTYRVAGINSNGEQVKNINSLDAIDVYSSGSGTVYLSWYKNDNATAYRIYRSVNGKVDSSYRTTTSSLSYTDNLSKHADAYPSAAFNPHVFVTPKINAYNSSSQSVDVYQFVRSTDITTGTLNKNISTVEAVVDTWKKVEVWFGVPNDTNSPDMSYAQLSFDMVSEYENSILWVDKIELYPITEHNFFLNEYYPPESAFSAMRPGEALLHPFLPSKDKAVYNGSSASTTKPVTFAVKNPQSYIAKEILSPQQQILPDGYEKFKYYISDSVKQSIQARYNSNLSINKIVIKYATTFQTINSGSVVLYTGSGSTPSTISLSSSDFNNSGLTTLYYNGSSWSTSSWTTPPQLSSSGTFQNVVNNVVGISFSANTTAKTTYSKYLSDNDKTRLHLIELSPRLEVDITPIVQDYSVRKELTSPNSNSFPLSYINSNSGTISISNIPFYQDDVSAYTIFENQSSSATFYNLMRQGVKFTGFLTSPSFQPDLTENVSQFVLYSNGWRIDDISNVSVELFDITKFYQGIDSTPYSSRNENLFSVIKTMLNISGFSDYDYDVLKYICQDIANTSSFWYDESKSVFENLQDLFIANQIGAFIDEYGIMRFQSLAKILQTFNKNSGSVNFAITDTNTSASGITYYPNIISDSYSEEISEKVGKIIINYKTPKVFDSVADDKRNAKSGAKEVFFKNSVSSPKIWWEESAISLPKFELRKSLRSTSNSIHFNPNITFAGPKKAISNYAGDLLIGNEIVGYNGMEYIFYPSTNHAGYITKIIKGSADISQAIEEVRNSYTNLITSVEYEPTGRLVNLQRGKYGTLVSDHIIYSPDNIQNQFKTYLYSTSDTKAVLNDKVSRFTIKSNDLVVTAKKKGEYVLMSPQNQKDAGYNLYAIDFSVPPASNSDVKDVTKTQHGHWSGKKWVADKNGNQTRKVVTGHWTDLHNASIGIFFNMTGINSDVVIGSKESNSTFFLEITSKQSSTGKRGIVYYLSLYRLSPSGGKQIAYIENISLPRMFDGETHRLSMYISNGYIDIAVDGKKISTVSVFKGFSQGTAGSNFGAYVKCNDTNQSVTMHIKEIYADTVLPDTNGKNIPVEQYESHARYFFTSKNFLNNLVFKNPNQTTNLYLFQSQPQARGIKLYDVTNALTPIIPWTAKIIPVVYGSRASATTTNNKAGISGPITKNDLMYSSLYASPFRSKFVVVNNCNETVELSSGTDNNSHEPIEIWSQYQLLSEQKRVERVIDSNQRLSIELNADWVGSEKDIDGMMELLSKSANTFYTDISISIFGNPLIQVGDFVKLVYTLKRIGTDSSKPLICLVTSVSQGFSEGLSETQLTIKPIIMP
jgi:hypothetical protein